MKNTTIWKDDELRWSIEEITYPENASKSKKLMRLVNSGKPFDIGWVELKKEIVSFNIKRERKNGRIMLSVCSAIDELPYDLMSDADPGLNCDEIDEILEDDEFSCRIDDISTEITDCESVKCKSTLEEISSVLMKLWKNIDGRLEGEFQKVKEIINEYKEQKNES